jgi:cyclophilin family peptidyl-prolyl cis-trans isomerase
MKKIFLLIIILFIFSGCGQNKPNKITEKNALEDIYSYDESGVVERINDINEGMTPKLKPSNKSSASDETAGENQIQLEDLASGVSQAVLKTNLGDITVSFYGQESPLTVNNFLNLAKAGFYNGTKFHRVIKDFMIQGGDPLSKDDNWADDGTGGPGYKFQDEINEHKLVRGSLAMANSGPNTNGSQFFIVTAESTPWLDGKHTNFGYVASGMEIVEKIETAEVNENDHPLQDVIIESIDFVEN